MCTRISHPSYSSEKDINSYNEVHTYSIVITLHAMEYTSIAVVYNHWTTGLDWTGDIETRVPGSTILFFSYFFFLHACVLCVCACAHA